MKYYVQICTYLTIIILIVNILTMIVALQYGIETYTAIEYDKTSNQGIHTIIIPEAQNQSYQVSVTFSSLDKGVDAKIVGTIYFVINNQTKDTYKFSNTGYDSGSGSTTTKESATVKHIFYTNKLTSPSVFNITVQITEATQGMGPINVKIYHGISSLVNTEQFGSIIFFLLGLDLILVVIFLAYRKNKDDFESLPINFYKLLRFTMLILFIALLTVMIIWIVL